MTDWRHRSLCKDEDPELFFPVGNSGPALLQIEQAKAICRRCPVIRECLAWALEDGQEAGVWGGMSEAERRAFKRGNRLPSAHQARPSQDHAATTPNPKADSPAPSPETLATVVDPEIVYALGAFGIQPIDLE